MNEKNRIIKLLRATESKSMSRDDIYTITGWDMYQELKDLCNEKVLVESCTYSAMPDFNLADFSNFRADWPEDAERVLRLFSVVAPGTELTAEEIDDIVRVDMGVERLLNNLCRELFLQDWSTFKLA